MSSDLPHCKMNTSEDLYFRLFPIVWFSRGPPSTARAD